MAVFLGEMEALSLIRIDALSSAAGSDIDRKYVFLCDVASLVSWLGGSIGAAADFLKLVLGDLVGDLIWCITTGDCALNVAIFFCK